MEGRKVSFSNLLASKLASELEWEKPCIACSAMLSFLLHRKNNNVCNWNGAAEADVVVVLVLLQKNVEEEFFISSEVA